MSIFHSLPTQAGATHSALAISADAIEFNGNEHTLTEAAQLIRLLVTAIEDASKGFSSPEPEPAEDPWFKHAPEPDEPLEGEVVDEDHYDTDYYDMLIQEFGGNEVRPKDDAAFGSSDDETDFGFVD